MNTILIRYLAYALVVMFTLLVSSTAFEEQRERRPESALQRVARDVVRGALSSASPEIFGAVDVLQAP